MRSIAIVLAAAAGLFAASSADASRPVPRTVTGCVIHGTFTDGQYTYSVRSRSGARIVETDLKRWEGQRIRIRGSLLPGDILIETSIRVLSPNCRVPIR